MKVSKADVDRLREVIEPLDTAERREQYKTGDFVRLDAVKDLDKRYRWDLFWAARGASRIDMVPYNDAHIDTALRAIVEPL